MSPDYWFNIILEVLVGKIKLVFQCKFLHAKIFTKSRHVCCTKSCRLVIKHYSFCPKPNNGVLDMDQIKFSYV